MQTRNLAFIGAGNMPRAIISGLVANGYAPRSVMASNPSTPKLEALERDFAIQVTQSNQDAVAFADVVVLSVKPQLMEAVCEDLQRNSDLTGKLFVSIAAGISIDRLQDMLGGEFPVVRTMPNTPSALGKGMTGLSPSSAVTEQDKSFVQELMASVGDTVWVDTEEQIDTVIAAAGSSPAYFFLFLEAMEKEAVNMGIAKQDARKLVQQAMLGAAEMVCHNADLELCELRAQVTSKGGTTAKAIEHFQNNNFEQTVAGAMQAAVARAKEMSTLF